MKHLSATASKKKHHHSFRIPEEGKEALVVFVFYLIVFIGVSFLAAQMKS